MHCEFSYPSFVSFLDDRKKCFFWFANVFFDCDSHTVYQTNCFCFSNMKTACVTKIKISIHLWMLGCSVCCNYAWLNLSVVHSARAIGPAKDEFIRHPSTSHKKILTYSLNFLSASLYIKSLETLTSHQNKVNIYTTFKRLTIFRTWIARQLVCRTFLN